MPRIRSIKPEFATDGSMRKLSDSCALFYILFWTHCDDEGKHPFDCDEVASKLGGRWHKGKVKLFMSCLIKSGQLRLNSDSTWVQVVQWSHQKIDKPKQPKVKSEDLQWLTPADSWIALEESRGIDARIKDQGSRIGEDQGSDHVYDGLPAGEPIVARKKIRAVPTQEPSATALVWRAYREAYLVRYGHEATSNANVMGKLKHFVARVPADEAPSIAAFYVSHNGTRYIQAGHAVGLLLQDAEKLRTEWATGRRVTAFDARNAEATDALRNQIARLTGGSL